MSATKRITKATVRLAARRLWPNCQIYVEHRPQRPSAATKQRLRERSDALQGREEELKAALDATAKSARSDNAVREAAQFVCDVNGDHPSIEQLRNALAERNAYLALVDERHEVREERRIITSKIIRDRYEIVTHRRGEIFTTIQCGADTLAELLAKVEAKQ